MSKSSMLKEGMKGGLNGLLSSTKKPSKEQIVTLSLQKKAIRLNNQGKTMIAKDSFVPLL